jgi:hypothetical protein
MKETGIPRSPTDVAKSGDQLAVVPPDVLSGWVSASVTGTGPKAGSGERQLYGTLGSRDWACYSFHHRRRPQAGELRFQFLDPSIAFFDCRGYLCGFKALWDVLRAIDVPRTDLK